jgi:hypothetical protein
MLSVASEAMGDENGLQFHLWRRIVAGAQMPELRWFHPLSLRRLDECRGISAQFEWDERRRVTYRSWALVTISEMESFSHI